MPRAEQPMSTLDGCRLALWVEERDGRAAVNPVMRGLLAALRADGAIVRVRVVERGRTTPRSAAGADLVLLKSFGPLACSLALATERHGQRFLNGGKATVRATDKAAVVAALAAARLAVPASWLRVPVTGRRESRVPVDARSGSGWYTKPVNGIHGEGVARHPGPTPPARSSSAAPELVQAAVGTGVDLKVYVAGDVVFAARKAFSTGSFASGAVERIPADPDVIRMARYAADALDLRCFGLDLRLDETGAAIVDANPFPGFRGFPDAVPALRRLVHASLGVAP